MKVGERTAEHPGEVDSAPLFICAGYRKRDCRPKTGTLRNTRPTCRRLRAQAHLNNVEQGEFNKRGQRLFQNTYHFYEETVRRTVKATWGTLKRRTVVKKEDPETARPKERNKVAQHMPSLNRGIPALRSRPRKRRSRETEGRRCLLGSPSKVSTSWTSKSREDERGHLL